MYLITGEFCCPLSLLIQKEYNKLIALFEQIPKSKRGEKVLEFTGGKASAIDIIAYQIGWGKLLINWYNTGKKNKIPVMPGEGFTSWDYIGLAKLFYEKYRHANTSGATSSQEFVFYTTVQEIIAFTEHEHKAGNLDKLGVWDWCTLASGKQWPLSKWVTINTAAPYKRAQQLLKKV